VDVGANRLNFSYLRKIKQKKVYINKKEKNENERIEREINEN
jgi:hypothetical protein